MLLGINVKILLGEQVKRLLREQVIMRAKWEFGFDLNWMISLLRVYTSMG